MEICWEIHFRLLDLGHKFRVVVAFITTKTYINTSDFDKNTVDANLFCKGFVQLQGLRQTLLIYSIKTAN